MDLFFCSNPVFQQVEGEELLLKVQYCFAVGCFELWTLDTESLERSRGHEDGLRGFRQIESACRADLEP